jgi:hypothetical protein
MLWVLDEACKVLAHPSMLVVLAVATGVGMYPLETMSVAVEDPTGLGQQHSLAVTRA